MNFAEKLKKREKGCASYKMSINFQKTNSVMTAMTATFHFYVSFILFISLHPYESPDLMHL
jgi:hypothetical protein